MGGKSGGSAKVDITEYYLSVHMGVCMGPAELIGLYFDEKEAWTGSVSTNQIISLDRPDLFGGQKKEGGVKGDVYYSYGAPAIEDISLPANLAKRQGLTSDTAPAYYGYVNMFFVGSVNSEKGGFLWGNNNPYIKTVWAAMRRVPVAFAAAPGEPSTYANVSGGQSNPAHMIYECLTNTDWGMGASPDIIDLSSFQKAAKTFFLEGFGLSMIWAQQTRIEDFISEILDHVQANFYVNPRTGLLTLSAVRGDYDPNDLKVLDENNCVVKKFSRKVWGETINEINISFTNPANEESDMVTLHDLANIEMQGGIVAETRDYYGVRSTELAMKVAVRDMRSASAPLAAFEIEANRFAWDVVPGSVIKLNYPELGIAGVVLRVMKVDWGRPGDSKILISAMEDVFGLPQSAYTLPGGSGWQDQSRLPSDMEYVKVLTLPRFFAARVADQLTSPVDYPEVLMGVLGATENVDTRSFELYGEATDAGGSVSMENFGTKPLVGRTALSVSVPAEKQTVLSYADLNLDFITPGIPPVKSGFAMIGDSDEENMEIVFISIVGSNLSTVTLERGVLDTVPRRWRSGTPVWFFDTTISWADFTRYAETDTVKYQLTPTTSKGTLALEDATEHEVTASARPYLPLRPANVQIDGQGFGVLFKSSGDTADMAVTWERRNKDTEDSQVVLWDAGDVTPEDGQTTRVAVYDTDDVLLTEHTGLTGTSFALPYTSFSGNNVGIVRVTSERDGFESLQGHEITVSFGTGYGTDYGNNYGAA